MFVVGKSHDIWMMRGHVITKKKLPGFILIMIRVLVSLDNRFDIHKFYKLKERTITKIEPTFDKSDVGRPFVLNEFRE